MHETYQSPWRNRYASPEMLYLFSDQKRYGLWRRLWLVLAEAQKEFGLSITQKQIDQLRTHLDDIDFDAVRKHEESVKHDVMAHLHAYAEQCPDARAILHLGATSCYVTDNADLLIQKEALLLIERRLVQILRRLSKLAEQYAAVPCLAYTHLQPAQATTIGKRFCLWLQDLLMDAQALKFRIQNLRLLGSKGAVGSQASFVTLFNGDHSKVQALDTFIATRLGFDNVYTVTSQTYPRKHDAFIADILCGIAASAHKFGTDLRLLAAKEEFFEAFGEKQVGSSAMPYKKNPVLAERLCGLARYTMTLSQNCQLTAALQWLERSLDDSSNRRLVLPELFLSMDAICNLWIHILKGIQINEPGIQNNLTRHAPKLATETQMMQEVSQGGDRQQIHERLRQSDTYGTALEKIETGCSEQQVRTFLHHEVIPFLNTYVNVSSEDTPVLF